MSDQIEKMREAIAFLRREVCGEITATHMELLLVIGMSEGITQHQLCTDFSMHPGNVSRNIRMMAQFCDNRNGRDVIKGYDLVETAPDLYHRQRSACFLTRRGKLVYRALNDILKGE
jgi:DNA-binding MarR family transcriptional regulator